MKYDFLFCVYPFLWKAILSTNPHVHHLVSIIQGVTHAESAESISNLFDLYTHKHLILQLRIIAQSYLLFGQSDHEHVVVVTQAFRIPFVVHFLVK